MTNKRKFIVTYRVRPLGLKMSQMLPSQIKLATVELEATDDIDAISAFAKFAQGLNLEDTLRTADFIEAIEVDKSFTAHGDATSTGCITCGNEWKSLNKEGRCSHCQQVWDS